MVRLAPHPQHEEGGDDQEQDLAGEAEAVEARPVVAAGRGRRMGGLPREQAGGAEVTSNKGCGRETGKKWGFPV